MRLLKTPSSLAPYEREMVSRLFPSGNESGSDVLARHYAADGFVPSGALSSALMRQFGEPEQTRPPGMSLPRIIIKLCFATGTGLILFAAISGDHDWRIVMDILIGGSIVAIVPIVLCAFPLGVKATLSIFLPIGLAAALLAALFTMQFASILPLSVWGSAGAALLAIGIVILLFTLLRTRESVALTRRRRDAALAARYAKKQLRRAQPALSDAWMAHFVALGLAKEVVRWRNRPRGAARIATLPSANLALFTGTTPPPPGGDWEDALAVVSKEDAS